MPETRICLFIIDVTSSMDNGDGDVKCRSYLQAAVEATKMIALRRILSGCECQYGLILAGTESTDNHINSEQGGFEHITTVQSIASPTVTWLQSLQHIVTCPKTDFSLMEAVVVAVDLFIRHGPSRNCIKDLIIFSTFGSCDSHKNEELSIANMLSTGVVPTVVAPCCLVRGEEIKPAFALAKNFLSLLGGDMFTFRELGSHVSQFKHRSVKQTTLFRGVLEISPSIKINVASFVLTRPFCLESFKDMSAPAHYCKLPSSGIKVVRSHHLRDMEVEVPPENTAKGYYFGSSIVPVDRLDQECLKLVKEKSLRILGFTPRSSIRPHFLQGKGANILVAPSGDSCAAVALSALVCAMEELECVGIVRMCSQRAFGPELGVLIPHIKHSFEGLVYIRLPFAEDVRHATFPAIVSSKRKSVSQVHQEKVDALIEAMMLSDGDLDLKLKRISNPVLQHHHQCILHRALHPEEKLPSPLVSGPLLVPDSVQLRAAPFIEDLMLLFSIKESIEADQLADEVHLSKVRRLEGISTTHPSEQLSLDPISQLPRPST